MTKRAAEMAEVVKEYQKSGQARQEFCKARSIDAAELLSAALKEMAPYDRAVLEAHFLDGDSVYKIHRRLNARRKDVEAAMETALGAMRTALRVRGVRAVADII